MDAFLQRKLHEGFAIETRRDTHAIIAKPSFRSRILGRGGASRYVVSVDEHGDVTMIPAEPKRS
jgi:hypothetical protein